MTCRNKSLEFIKTKKFMFVNDNLIKSYMIHKNPLPKAPSPGFLILLGWNISQDLLERSLCWEWMLNKYHSTLMFVLSFAKDVNALKKVRSRGKKKSTNQPTTHDPQALSLSKKDLSSFFIPHYYCYFCIISMTVVESTSFRQHVAFVKKQ